MSDVEEGRALGQQMLDAVKVYVGRAVSAVAQRVDELDLRLAEIPAGPSAYQLAVQRGYAGTELQWLDSLRGESIKGDPGRDADQDFIRDEIARAVAALPKPKDGVSVTVEDVAPLIASQSERIALLVRAQLDVMPKPENGKDADPELVAKLVREAVDALPRAADGKSVTLEDVAPLIVEEARKATELIHSEIERAVAALPAARDGRDADPEAIRAEVERAVAALPVPKDGKDVDPAEITRVVAEAVAALPRPADGKSVTLEDAAPLISEEVSKAVAAIPKPKNGKDGKDADPEDIRAAVARAVAELPAPKDGRDADPEVIERAIAEAVAALPRAVTLEDVTPLIARVVADAVAAIPAPKDGEPGRDVDPELIRSMVNEAVAQIPKPKDGKDAEPVAAEVMQSIVEQEVDRAVGALPRPRDGKDADPVHPDTIARMVLEEVQRVVAAMPRAKDGEPGRDAIALDILPGIEETKSYPRGTFAEHRGGVIRAIRNTDPITEAGLDKAGWVVSMNGVAEEREETLDDGRTLKRTTIYTSGRELVREIKTAIMLDRGVWREGSYEKGDTVSWGGSGWIAQRTTTDKPGTSDAWRLAIKKGRDGKDAGEGSAPAGPPVVRTR